MQTHDLYLGAQEPTCNQKIPLMGNSSIVNLVKAQREAHLKMGSDQFNLGQNYT